MKKHLKKLYSSSLVRSSGIYTISSVINSAIPFLLLPILTTELTPADYGVLAMFQVVVSAVYPLVGINLEAAIARKYFDKDNTVFAEYIGTCVLLSLFSTFLVAILFSIFFIKIQEFSQIPPFWLKFVILVAFFQFLNTIILTFFQVKVKPMKYGAFQISRSIVDVSLTLIFVVLLNKNYAGRLEAQIISNLLFGILAVIILYKSKNIRLRVLKKDISSALKFGVPLIPHAIGGMLFTGIDRYFLTNMVGLAQTGNYTVAFQIGAMVSLITAAFNNAWVPWLFENLNKNDQLINKKIVKFTYLYFIVLACGSFILTLIFPLITRVFVGKAFTSVDSFSNYIILGFVFQGMYFMVTNYITYVKKTYLLAIITISVALIKIPITYYSIVWLGASGASVSWAITFLIFFLFTWILSARVYKMPWFSFIN